LKTPADFLGHERWVRTSVSRHAATNPAKPIAADISRCGDGLARTLMYEAAVVILHRVKRPLHLKDWAAAIEQRSGPGKARVALARKLSVILHSVWRSGEPFRWIPQVIAA
jgi:transposase